MYKNIYILFSRNLLESHSTKENCSISRPQHDSFRHTGHGSPFGLNWGSPAFLDPEYLSQTKRNDVELRGKN